jgi:hypothetical protein
MNLQQIFESGTKEEKCNVVVSMFQQRDIRGPLYKEEKKGKQGNREEFYQGMMELYRVSPEITKKLISFIPEYGCWKDLWELLRRIPPLEDTILSFMKKTFVQDVLKCRRDDYDGVTYLAKWLPREKSKTYPGLAYIFADFFYPAEGAKRKRIQMYRKDVSMVNRAIQTVEIIMCSRSWGSISPTAVPKKCLRMHRNAFLRMDRECRERFLTYYEDLGPKWDDIFYGDSEESEESEDSEERYAPLRQII